LYHYYFLDSKTLKKENFTCKKSDTIGKFLMIFIVSEPILRHSGEFEKIRLLTRETTRFLPEGFSMGIYYRGFVR
jgi:hypothetical protein